MPARPFSTLVALLLLTLGFSHSARAQELDDTWFKVTLSLKGDAVAPDDEVGKAKGKVVCYLNLAAKPAEAPPEGGLQVTPYDYTVYSETTIGNWQPSSIGTLYTTGANERLMIGTELSPSSCGIQWQVVVPDEDGTVLQVSFVARTQIALDKQGGLKKASFKSTGALVPYGQGGDDLLVGSAKLKGKLIPVDKLPFDPDSE